MIFVDTSVRVEYFRGRQAIVEQLNSLLDDMRVAICTPVKLEIVLGATKKEAAILKKLLGALPEFIPTSTHWAQAYKWAKKRSDFWNSRPYHSRYCRCSGWAGMEPR